MLRLGWLPRLDTLFVEIGATPLEFVLHALSVAPILIFLLGLLSKLEVVDGFVFTLGLPHR